MLKICPILPVKMEACLRDGLYKPLLLWQYVLSKCAGQCRSLCHSEGYGSNIKHLKTNHLQAERRYLATL